MGNDLISRDALKEAIRKRLCISSLKYLTEQEKVIVDEIDNAPPVIVDNCGKCPYYKDRDRDIITEAYNDGYKTAKEDFENHKLVNNSQELVKDLVKEKSRCSLFETHVPVLPLWGRNGGKA